MERVMGALPLELRASLVRALDRPAREALELGRAPFARSAALGIAGLALWAASGICANALLGRWNGADALGGALEALAIALPGLLVFAIYLEVAVPPRALVAAQAVGLWTAGVVSACVLPLLAFINLATHGEPQVAYLRDLLVPGVGLAVATTLPLRILLALDRRGRARWLGRLFVATVAVAFMFKLQLAFPYLLDLSSHEVSAEVLGMNRSPCVRAAASMESP